MEKVNLVKNVNGINTYSNAINTQFTELIPESEIVPEPEITVEQFFTLYDQLFFDIPPEGEINSHSYLVLRSGDYLGGSPIDPEKQALIEEINALRQQILDLGQTFLTTDKLT